MSVQTVGCLWLDVYAASKSDVFVRMWMCIKERKEMFYLRLYGIRHMVKDHSDSQRGNPLLAYGLLFLISSKGSFICTPSHRQDNTYHSLCYTSREIALTTELRLAPRGCVCVPQHSLYVNK